MEASMTDVVAPSNWFLDFQIPSILRRWDGRVRPCPAPVPELAADAAPDPRHYGDEGREVSGQLAQGSQTLLEPGAIESDECSIELLEVKSQIPALTRERDELRMALGDLNSQIPALIHQRVELLATAVPLSAEVSDLQSKQRELIFLRSEIQALRKRKSSLEKSITALRGPTEKIRGGRTENQKYHDS
jgi:chromosome segregation ATPase